MKSVAAVVVLALAVVCLAEDKIDCKDVFNPTSKDHIDAAKKCEKPDAKPLENEEAFIKSGYDDQCTAKCTMEELKMFKDGKMDKTAILKDVADMVKDKAVLERVKAFTEECFKKAEALTDAKGECSRPSFYVNCFLKAQGNMCMKPAEPAPKP